MQFCLLPRLKVSLALTACVGLGALALAGGATPSARPAAAAKNSPPAAEPQIPQSVFEIPLNPKQGRNPFYPQSTAGVQVPQPKVKTLPEAVFVLNGITSPPRRTAMINNRTFEPGEEAEVRISSGAKVMIKCVEIKDDSAAIIVGGERRELRLRSGL